MTGRIADAAGEAGPAVPAALGDGSAKVNGTTAGSWRSWTEQPAAMKGTGNPAVAAAAVGTESGGVSARNPHPPPVSGTSTSSADGCRWPGAGAAAGGHRGSAWRD